MRSVLNFYLLLAVFSVQSVACQENINPTANGKALRVYLDGEIEDFNYLRRNIKYVDFVNDPKLSDVQVIATRLMLASGGRKYFLNFYSGERREVSDLKLSFIHNPNDTDDMDRVRFGKTLEIGLLKYLTETPVLDQVEIGFSPKQEDTEAKITIPEQDPWNFWVFRLTGTGGWDLEESKTSISYSGSVQADRISDKWLIKNYLSHQNSTRTYKQSEDEIYKSINIADNIQSKGVYAITDHWSTGLFLNVDRSTYINTDLGISLKPAVEYNFFKWKDADQKVFTLAYYMGPAYYNYKDTTFLNKMQESLWEHNLLVQLEMIQPWGEVDVQLGYEGYLSDLSNYNLSAEADISLRISKGLSIYFELSAESVHNQLYLPKDEVSLEELLLNSRKLPTTFELGGEVGFRIYFGSLYNNIVNERF